MNASHKLSVGLEVSVPDWIIEYPKSHAIFDELQIDTSCGGKSLEYACQQRGLDPGFVLQRLTELVKSST